MVCPAGQCASRGGLGAFLLMAVVIGYLGTALKGTLNDSFSLPDTESLQAQQLLEQMQGDSAARRRPPPPRSSGRRTPTARSAVDAGDRRDHLAAAHDDLQAARRRLRDRPVQQDRRAPRHRLPDAAGARRT